jgi:signal transduction histidine kinase
MSSFNTPAAGSAVPPFALHSSEGCASSHSVQFYTEDNYLLDAIASFIGPALGKGDVAVVIATGPHRDGLAERLRLQGLDLHGLMRQNCYISLDANETLAQITSDGAIDAARFTKVIGSTLEVAQAAASATSRVVVFGEMVALLWSEGKAESAIELENLWNCLGQTRSFSLRCAYPMKGFNRDEHRAPFLQICEAHSAVIPSESYTALGNDEERLRSITQLQQRAEALETERTERNEALHLLQEKDARLKLANLELEMEVKQRMALRRLSAMVLTLQDAERRRIARELHDSLGQYLASLKINLNLLSQFPQRGDLWQQSQKLMTQCISEVRTLSHLLHPPMIEEAGLSCAARWFAEGFGERSGIQIAMHIPSDWARLPQPLEIALFRVLQEALTNVHRHSAASAVKVRLSQAEDQVSLEVQDNGKGMTPELLARFRETGTGVGVGLAGMRERIRELGGELEVQSESQGVCVRAAVPLTAIPTAMA